MMSLSEAAQAVQAQQRGRDTVFHRVCTDSRQTIQGDLFVALRGEHFDGHRFVGSAWGQGAVAAVVDHEGDWDSTVPQLMVDNTKGALGRLAAYWRNRFSIPVVAITGSNGKTTVKEMLAEILHQACDPYAKTAVLATRGNLNNDIGLPLTLLELRAGHHYAVLEMGANHPGEIGYLSRIARPNMALVNNAGPAHLEGLESVARVAQEKGDIYSGLMPGGTAILNADDPHAQLWRSQAAPHPVWDFGIKNPAAVRADFTLDSRTSTVRIDSSAGHVEAHLAVPGIHNVYNALAAAAAALALHISSEAVGRGLAQFTGVKGRLQRRLGVHGATLIDDTYNANPASVHAAISVLASCPGKKILVLGDMGELGGQGRLLHEHVGTEAKRSGINRLFTLGELSAAATESFGRGAQHFETIEQLLAELENLLDSGTTVLVKGSRFMQMERVIKSFAQER
jgi:UDP-N-acetylmuramoyl-tripeptide--D-alanyl-D-alanine ligase